MDDHDPPRVAFVQDALPFFGGGERVLNQALRVFPSADVYTLVFNTTPFEGTLIGGARVFTSFIDRLPGAHRYHRAFVPLYPLAMESFDLSGYDIVISFSYASAHGVLTDPGQTHVALFYTPMRQAYDLNRQAINGGALHRFGLKLFSHYFRIWDCAAADRPDHLLAISDWVAGLVWRTYHRRASVIYPPVEIERFRPAPERQDYFICVARMEAHKKLDVVVEAFNRTGFPLVLVGEGRQKKQLQKMARSNIRFLDHQTDSDVADLLSRAKAFVHAGTEDFGIALVEAQAAGCPVIAYQRGGASETVINGHTGILFPEQTAESLIDAISRFESRRENFWPLELQSWASRFSAQRFRYELATYLRSIGGGNYPLKVSDEYRTIPAPAEV